MNDKEYTYDIDKYTICVDENGEDEIGMTVGKIENNGMIRFLGNCYGENARCIDLLIKENQELKEKVKKLSQWDNNKDSRNSRQRVANAKLIKENQELKKQVEEYQKELEKADNLTQICIFKGKEESKISYRKCLNILDKKETQQKEFIEWLENEINKIKEQIKNYDIWHEAGTDINFLILKKQFNIEILQKYNKIIGENKS